MRKIYFFLALFAMSTLHAQQDFLIKINTSNSGAGCLSCFTIPIKTTVPISYNYSVDWENDGIFDTVGVLGNVTHVYDSAGVYTIRIGGAYPASGFGEGPALLNSRNDIIEILQWGDQQWETFHEAFTECENLVMTATDTPDLSLVSSLAWAFLYCSSLQGDFSAWDVSNVTDMRGVFAAATMFNSDLSSWNVNNVENMSSMFDGATNFSSDLSSWDVGNVERMTSMFANSNFNNNSISNWNTSSLERIKRIFSNNTVFDQDLNWNVSNVTDFEEAFHHATAFNGDISNWDVRNGTNFYRMFEHASTFNRNISNWEFISMSTLYGMFEFASSFNQPVGQWDMSGVRNIDKIFLNATSFNQNLGQWNLNDLNAANFFDDIFVGTSMSCENYSQTLIGWSGNTAITNGIGIHMSGLEYDASAAFSRDILINQYGWTISGDVQSASGCFAPLPVELISFRAVREGDSNEIFWSVGQEMDVSHYELERSIGSDSQFVNIVDVDASGEDKYSYTDRGVIGEGGAYYRLRSVDMDGFSSLSEIVYLEKSANPKVKIFPNPTIGDLFVSGLDANRTHSILIINAVGQLIMMDELNRSESRIDISKLGSGFYLVSIKGSSDMIYSTHFIVK